MVDRCVSSSLWRPLLDVREFHKDDISRKPTIEDHFHIGSVSKSFGATVHLLLTERGTYALNDTMKDLIPQSVLEFPAYANFTVQHLLGMRTNVFDFLNDGQGLLHELILNPDKRFTIEEVVGFALRNGVSADPGVPFVGQYSTTNYLVLEYLAETLTGYTMSQLVSSMVLEPLDLTETSLPLRDEVEGALDLPAATPYVGPKCAEEFVGFGATNVTKGMDLTDISRSIVVSGTGGSMQSNILDLLKWAKSGTGDSLLNGGRKAARHDYDWIQPGVKYGLGQHTLNDPLGDFYGHSGDAFGFGAFAFKTDLYENAAFASAVSTCSYTDLFHSVLATYDEELKKINSTTDTAIAPSNSSISSPTTNISAGGQMVPSLLLYILPVIVQVIKFPL